MKLNNLFSSIFPELAGHNRWFALANKKITVGFNGKPRITYRNWAMAGREARRRVAPSFDSGQRDSQYKAVSSPKL